jgi:hypothetical protein
MLRASTMNIPKYVIGETQPGGSVWVVRTADPLLYALVEPRADSSIHLNCGPASAVQEVPEEELQNDVREMLIEWLEQVHGKQEKLPAWDYSFGTLDDPDHLVCKCGRSGFIGLLRLATPRMWALPADDPRMLATVAGIDTPTETAIEDCWDWWHDYITNTDETPFRQRHGVK